MPSAFEASDLNVYTACIAELHVNQCIRTTTVAATALVTVFLCEMQLVALIRSLRRCFSHRMAVLYLALSASLYVSLASASARVPPHIRACHAVTHRRESHATASKRATSSTRASVLWRTCSRCSPSTSC